MLHASIFILNLVLILPLADGSEDVNIDIMGGHVT